MTDHRSEDEKTRSLGARPSGPTPSLTRLGDFEILREIGRGGMGLVYEARQVSLGRRVALKVLPPAFGLNRGASRRFDREARTAARLHHTNIVPVHAIDEQDGYYFYAMELIEGPSLDRVLADLRVPAPSRDEPSSGDESEDWSETTVNTLGDSQSETSQGARRWFDQVARLVAEVADGLAYAHGRGVIHRDIKPGNLILSPEGQLCVTDFGLARVMDEPGMTVSGSFLGTPAYMSPEQIAAGRIELDHRTDIYSLGAVLYEMLTLKRPFSGTSRDEVLTAIMTRDPTAPRKVNPKVPQDLETICLKAMEKDPARRYANAEAFAADLRNYLRRDLITARRASLPRRAWKAISRRPVLATILVAVVVSATAIGGVLWSVGRRSAEEALERQVLDAELAYRSGLYAWRSRSKRWRWIPTTPRRDFSAPAV
jgi:serine/threonine protein kinase